MSMLPLVEDRDRTLYGLIEDDIDARADDRSFYDSWIVDRAWFAPTCAIGFFLFH